MTIHEPGPLTDFTVPLLPKPLIAGVCYGLQSTPFCHSAEIDRHSRLLPTIIAAIQIASVTIQRESLPEVYKGSEAEQRARDPLICCEHRRESS